MVFKQDALNFVIQLLPRKIDIPADNVALILEEAQRATTYKIVAMLP